MTRINLKRYGLYLFRWQLSTPILAGVLYVLSAMDKINATIIANFVGGLVFYWVDMFIFTSDRLAVQWEVKDRVFCIDCGKEARGYRITKAKDYDKMKDSRPEFRCEECSMKKTQELRERGFKV